MELCVQTGSHGFSSHHIFLMKSFIFKSLHLRLLRKTHTQTLPNLLSFVHVLWRYVQLMHFAVWGLLCFPLSRTRCSHKLPLTFNFLHTLTSLKFKTLFIFLSCKVAAVWSLLGLTGSGNAQVSFSLRWAFPSTLISARREFCVWVGPRVHSFATCSTFYSFLNAPSLW